MTAISAGSTHACAITHGRVWCWGANVASGLAIDGRLGTDSILGSAEPLAIAGIEGATAISAGGTENCAVVDGRAWCWGKRQGEPASGTPRVVEGLEDVTAVSAASGWHRCAVAGGRLWCWGELVPRLDGTTVEEEVPTPMLFALEDVTAVSAGEVTTCAIAGGEALCFSRDWGGASNVSKPPTRLEAASAVSAGEPQQCAIARGRVWCWEPGMDPQPVEGLPPGSPP